MKSYFLRIAAVAAVLLAALPAVPTSLSAAPAAPAKVKKLDNSKLKFRVTTNKSPVSYKTGEEMIFRISLDYGQELPAPMKFFVQWSRLGDDGITKIGMDEIAPGRDVIIKTSIDRPGFVRIHGRLVDVKGNGFRYMVRGEFMADHAFDGSAGADVDKILPAIAEPADFDAFWKKQHEALAKVPVKPVMTQIPKDKLPEKYAGKFSVFAVSVPCAGPRPVTGYLIVPANAKAKSLPAQVSFDGYGEGGKEKLPSDWEYSAAADRILFHINAHGYDLGQPPEYYTKFFATRQGYAMNFNENQKPETSYFQHMSLRVIRAFDFVKTLPQWNGKDLIAQGGSQGGLQTSWAGSQVKGLTECNPSVTWCSDTAGTSIGRLGGWRPDYAPGLGYYDTVFHARRIPATCKLNITRAGLGDYVCPPSGLAAQFNSANCPKRIRWMQNSSHMTVPPDPETVVVELPAGKAITGVAPKPVVAQFPKVAFVNAVFSDWEMEVNDKTIKLGKFNGPKQIRKKMADGGKDLPVMTEAELKAELTADADGFVLIGAGIDWWWECFVEQNTFFGDDKSVPVFGRVPSIGGGNGKATFKKTDWIFRVPVKQGKNKIKFKIVLGEQGFAEIGTIPLNQADNEISIPDFENYVFYRDGFPEPDSDFEAKKCLFSSAWCFDTAQAYPAGIEYRFKGEKKWQSVWDDSFSTSHKVVLPMETFKGKEVEMRIAQQVFYSGWRVMYSEVKTQKF